jgi:hypothetical protein
MGQFLKFLGLLAVLLLVVPLAGLAVTGSWVLAWRYTKTWARVIAWTAAVGAVVSLIALQFMPPPG